MSWIYKNSLDNRQRYVLGEEGSKILVCIGINPSTAEPNNLDNTLIRVKNRALSLGYDSWIMINVYPQRATNPDKLHKNLHLDIHKKNILEISETLKGRNFDVWAAWGTLLTKRKYLKRCLSDIVDVLGDGFDWFTIGKRSVDGHPHHPLYLTNGLPLDSFSISSYIKLLSK
ncbi:MAG: DUF1643 domain-containing protein [Spirochaetaceae bacterium]